MSVGEDYLSTVISRLRYYKLLGEKTIDQLTEKELHWQPSSESNSIAVIIQHIAGNMLSRWTNFLTEDGEKEWRKRDEEFEVRSLSKSMILEIWNNGWDCFLNALGALGPDDLVKTVQIRNETLTVTDAINRQLAHYPYHIGQIVYIGKMIKNEDWQNLSIPRKGSQRYNEGEGIKDPAKRFSTK